MKRYNAFVTASVLLLAAACTENALSTDKAQPGTISGVLPELNTRVELGMTMNVTWNAGDVITMMSESTPQGAPYMTLSEGTSTGVFTPVDAEVAGSVRYAVFPEDALSGSLGGNSAPISFAGLANQTYAPILDPTCDISKLPMIAFSENKQFSFKNLCGGVKFILQDFSSGVMIKSFSLTASGGEQITGTADVDLSTGEFTLPASGGSNVITITGFEDVRTSMASGEGIVVFLPACTYSSGLVFRVELEDGTTLTYTTANEITVAPGLVTPLSPRRILFHYGDTNSYLVKPAADNVSIDITPHLLTLDSIESAAEQALAAGWNPAVSASIIWQQGGDIIGTPSINGNILNVPVIGNPGNALVAIKDESGTILWSYHVWVSEVKDVEYKGDLYGGSFKMMDRNLGATNATDPSKNTAFGCFYQWGRKDPFPINLNAQRPSGSPYESPLDGAHLTVAFSPEMTVGFATMNPDIRILNRGAWFDGTAEIYKYFWGNPEGTIKSGKGTKSVFDPCPAGYRVPDPIAYYAICENNAMRDGDGNVLVNQTSDAKTEFNSIYANYFKTGTGQTALWPGCGIFEFTENHKFLRYRGYYWSNVIKESGKGSQFYFNNSNVQVTTENYIAVGAPVRCMKI